MFVTALRQLKSPQNVGVIVRSHVAFGGHQIIFIADQLPWRFKKSSQAFSRKLERRCEILYCETDEQFFDWCVEHQYIPIGVEISETAQNLSEFIFPERSVLIIGNEGKGLSSEFLSRCSHTVVVPQFGPVGSLNASVACSIVQYEHGKQWGRQQPLKENKFEGEIEVS